MNKWEWQFRKGLALLLLTTVVACSGCSKNQEQKNPEETLGTAGTAETEGTAGTTETDSPEDSAQQGEEQTTDGQETEEKGDKSSEGDSEIQKDTEDTENPDQTGEQDNTDDGEQDEQALSIERIGEPESYEAEDGTSLFVSALYYPVISMPEKPEVAARINQVFEDQKKADEGLVAEYRDWAQSDYQERQEQGGMDFLNYALDRDYVVAFTGKRLLCLNEVEYSYMGGAHPNNLILTWNFDLETGEVVSWEQMTDDIEGFRGFLKERTIAFLEDEQATTGIGTELLYPNYEEVLPQLLEKPNWYVEGEKLMIVFNQYDIAPYAAGLITIELPLTELEGYWNAYGQELLQP